MMLRSHNPESSFQPEIQEKKENAAPVTLQRRYFSAFIVLNSLAFVAFALYFFRGNQERISLPSLTALATNLILLLLYNRINAHRWLAVAFVFSNFFVFVFYAAMSGGILSPFVFWLISFPLMALLLFGTRSAILATLVLIGSLLGLYFFKDILQSFLPRLSLSENYWFLSASASGQVLYWMVIFIVGDHQLLKPSLPNQANLEASPEVKNPMNKPTPSTHKDTSEIAALKEQIHTLEKRNALLVKLYDNLKTHEEYNQQKAEVLAEAARVLDNKNKEIKLTRDKYIEQTDKLEEVYEDLQNSIRYAKKIQQSIIPDPQTLVDSLSEAFVFYQPKDIVSGDFYFFAEAKNEEGDELKVLVAADCTGHGVPGAFMTFIGNSLLNEIIEKKITRPDLILTELDKKIIQTLSNRTGHAEIHDGMDMVVLTINQTKNLVYYAAAHNPVYHVRAQKLNQIKGSRFAVGSSQYRTKKEFKLHTIESQPGDMFYIFTDGFQDQFGKKEQRKYMTRRFRSFLLSINRLPLSKQLEVVGNEFQHWKDDLPQTDDVLVIGFRT